MKKRGSIETLRKYKNILTKDFINKEHWENNKSLNQISKEIGCASATVWKYAKELGIKTRNLIEALNTKEYKKEMGEIKKGQIPWNTNKSLSKETKRKTSTLRRGAGNPNFGRRGNEAFGWKDGRRKASNGYILIYSNNHPHRNNNKYVGEHRLIMEAYLNGLSYEIWKALIDEKLYPKDVRFLKKEEIVHHINEIIDDNRLENLMLFKNDSSHLKYHRNPNNVKQKDIMFDGNKLTKGV